MSSRTLFNEINLLMTSNFGIKFLGIRTREALTSSEPSKTEDLGKLLKALVAFHSREEKMIFFYEVVITGVDFILRRTAAHSRAYFRNVGRLLQHLFSDWKMEQALSFVFALEDKNNIQNMLSHVLSSSPGQFPEEECVVSSYYKGFYYSSLSPSKRYFWISQLFYLLSTVEQAKILVMMFAPVKPDGHLNWDAFDLNDFAVFAVAKIILSLYETHSFNLAHIVRLVIETFSFPNLWRERNLYGLLLYCEKDIFKAYVKSAYNDGTFYSTSLLIVTIAENILVRHRLSEDYFNTLAHTTMDALESEWEGPGAKEDFLKAFKQFSKSAARNEDRPISQRKAARLMRRVFKRNFSSQSIDFFRMRRHVRSMSI